MHKLIRIFHKYVFTLMKNLDVLLCMNLSFNKNMKFLMYYIHTLRKLNAKIVENIRYI